MELLFITLIESVVPILAMDNNSAEFYRLKCLCDICIYLLSFYCLPPFPICLLTSLGLGHKLEGNRSIILISNKESDLPEMTPNLHFTSKGHGVFHPIFFSWNSLISFS